VEPAGDNADGLAEPATPTARAIRAIEAAVAVISRCALGVAGSALAGVFVMICYGVAMRYFVGRPQPWVDESAGWLLVGSVMLAIPEVQRRGDHIGIDFLAGKLRSAGRRRLLVFSILTVLATAIIFVREGIVMVEFSRMLNVLSNQIPEVPLWLVQGFVPVGFALMALVAAVQLACVLAGLKPRDMSDTLKEDV
jgi:TRAP-type C4-dicarboxylate transport system permease small subunit